MKPINENKPTVKTGLLKKNLFFFPLFVLSLIFVLFSCRNDNDDQTEAENLVGIWQPYKMNQKATLSTGNYDRTTDFTVCQQKSRIVFGADSNGSTKTYTDINDNCVLQGDANFRYTYDADSNILVITNADGSSQSGSVVELTNSALVYELTGTYDFEGENNVLVKTTFYARKTKD